MNQAFQLGFRSLMLSSSFAVSHRKLRIATSVWPGVCEMGSKRSLLNSSASKFPKIDERQDKKMKGLVFAKENANELVVQGNGEKIHTVDVQSFKEDPSKIETMTVQELRSALRGVGIPAKGNKRNLVSTFKCFLEKTVNGASSGAVEEEEEEDEEEEELPISAENIVVNLKAKNSADEIIVQDYNAASENPGASQRNRRSKHLPDGGETVRVNAKTVTTKKKVSVKSSETSGGKMLRVEKKTLPGIVLHENGVDRTQSEPWTVLAHKKPQKDWIPYNPKTMRPSPLSIDSKFLKILSWNVNGLRALLKLEGFSALELAQREDFDVLCLQETKLQEKDVEDIRQCLIDGYDNSFWTCSVSKLGYSGTAIISRVQPLSVRYGLGISDHDSEGRVVTAEFDSFYLLSVYVPNSGDGLKRLTYRVAEWDPSLSNYIKELEKYKPVILTGDLNCAHQEIDIYNPAGNKRSAGFTDEERHSFGTNFLSRGFVDSFRKQHPGVIGYTYWGYRHGGRKTNKGWRLDYFLVSESMAENVHDSYILPDVLGSDHCPIGLVLKL